jgi:hypothetical protein
MDETGTGAAAFLSSFILPNFILPFMARSLPAEIIPFDRFWRASHPMRPRTSGPRRYGMLVLLVVLFGGIGGYAYLTNSGRVRQMAENYLSQVLGGDVQVRRATLSIFQGLRIDDVRVRLAGEPVDAPPIFSADTFVVRYSLRKLLTGKIEATQIIAKRPHVQLTQDVDSLVRSYRRMVSDRPPGFRPRMTMPSKPPPLPEISLRDARIDYRETHVDGTTSVGTLVLEGQFTPVGDADQYEFSLQSRGISEKIGPYVKGTLFPRVGRVSAQLRDFELGRDIRLMLPAPVRRWWEQHELAGRVDITDMSYTFPRGQSDAKFTVRAVPQGVTLSVHPGEMMSSDESNRIAVARGALDAMSEMYRVAGYVDRGPWKPVEDLFTTVPIKLDRMSGTFVFTESGIVVEDVQGDVEGNRIYIDGKIDGYPGRAGVPEPPGTLRVTSGDRPLTLQPDPAYTNSLPRAVREIYDQLRPHGQCKIAVTVARPTAGAKLGVNGSIDVLDGNFVFLRFPYPVRKATGLITFAPASGDAPERLEVNLKGMGIEGGPNENTTVSVVGLIGPLGNDAGVSFRVQSDDVYSEDALSLAFPHDVQRTLKLFDAEGKGRYPIFHGKFTCDVNRPIGPTQRWKIFTHVRIDRATGSLVAFPYPLKDLAMELKIGDNYVEVINANVRKGDAIVRVDGKVTWGPTVPVRVGELRTPARSGPTTLTELTVKGANLLSALPEDRRAWLEKLGLWGYLDIDGTIRSDTRMRPTVTDGAPPPPGKGDDDPSRVQVGYDLDVTLRDGTLWPRQGAFVLSGVKGKLKLAPDRIDLIGLSGTRGGADVTGDGAVTFGPTGTAADVKVSARNLPLDAQLYAMLPAPAREAWDEVRPRGTIDTEVSYVGPIIKGHATKTASTMATTIPTTASSDARQTVVIRPRELSVFPKVFPYALDRVSGRAVVADGKTTLHQVTGRHGDATLGVWGAGQSTPGGGQAWDVTLFARDVPADEALVSAMPTAMAEWLRSMKLTGKVGWYFPKFSYRSSGGTSKDIGDGDVEMSGKVTMTGASMDVGVPLTKVDGTVGGSVSVVDGKLSSVHGSLDLDRLMIADRDASDFRAAVDREAGSQVLRMTKMRTEIADGDMAGDVTVTSPDEGPGNYSLNIVLRDADAATIAAMPGKSEIKGRLSASVALEGTFDDPNSRRGRGDVLATGKGMYTLPVVMGLLQITNLGLPISSPFNEASARYSVEGQRVTFDSINLKSDTLVMQGDGHLDFDTKKVALTFTTDNPNAIRIPFISDLWRNAQQELFKIEVRGTVQEPKVSANALNTVTTTVDEVFNARKR